MSKKQKPADLIEEEVVEEVETAVEPSFVEAKEEVVEPSNIASLSAKAARLEAEANRLREAARKMLPTGDIRMLNPKGVVRDIPARMINDCRRKGFLAVDAENNVLPNENQPPIITEFAESQTQPKAVKGGAPKVRDLD